MSKLKLRCCGCLFILILFLLLLCGLLALVLSRPRTARAQVTDAPCAILAYDADQPSVRTFSLTPNISEASPSNAARGIFFQKEITLALQGSERICLTSSLARSDLRVDDQIEIAVRHRDGTTATWQHDFADPRTGGITALPPQDISTLFAVGPNRVHVALRDTRPPVYSARPVWLIMFQPPEVSPAPLSLSPTPLPLVDAPTSTPPPPMPTATPEPEATATPAQTVALAATATGSTNQPKQIRLWPMALAGAVVAAGIVGLVMRARPKPAARPEVVPADSGTLEVCNPKTDDIQQFELRELGLGEVWGIGNSPQCKIKLGRDLGDQEFGVLVMTPDGPVVKSRGAPMWFEDEQVKEHPLFDGDDVYLGQFVLTYRNFFRRRGLDDEEENEDDRDRDER